MAEEGKSIKNEIQEVGGLDPPVPPPTHPFLTIKTETCIKNEECGNLTTGKRIKERKKGSYGSQSQGVSTSFSERVYASCYLRFLTVLLSSPFR